MGHYGSNCRKGLLKPQSNAYIVPVIAAMVHQRFFQLLLKSTNRPYEKCNFFQPDVCSILQCVMFARACFSDT